MNFYFRYSFLIVKLILLAAGCCLLPIVAGSNSINDKSDEYMVIYDAQCDDESFSVLLTSDIHMQSENVTCNKECDGERINNKRDMMIKYVNDKTKNVRGIILNGDLAGNFGKQSETDAFLKFFYDPLAMAIKSKYAQDMVEYNDEVVKIMTESVKPNEKPILPAAPVIVQIYLGLGNHDTYFHSGIEEAMAKAFPEKIRNRELEDFFVRLSGNEPYPTAMMRFVKDRHRGYQYSFILGGVKFIALGLYPSNNFAGGVPTEKYFPSLAFLRGELGSTIRTSKTGKGIQRDPVIIFFHYPMSGDFADWWSKKEKDDFYDAIKIYNIRAIFVGHSHTSAIYSFREKIPTIQAGDDKFAAISINPKKEYEVTVSFIDGRGVSYPGQNFVSQDNFEPDLKQ